MVLECRPTEETNLQETVGTDRTAAVRNHQTRMLSQGQLLIINNKTMTKK